MPCPKTSRPGVIPAQAGIHLPGETNHELSELREEGPEPRINIEKKEKEIHEVARTDTKERDFVRRTLAFVLHQWRRFSQNPNLKPETWNLKLIITTGITGNARRD
jgi:hypothetical protein